MRTNKFGKKIFLNNKYVDASEANISVLSHSLHFSSSVFEGIRVYNKKPFFIKSHIRRLINSCKIMHLDIDYTIEQIIDICNEIVIKNHLSSGYLRPIVYRGVGSMAPESTDCNSMLAVAGWKWEKLYEKKSSIKLFLSHLKKPHEKYFPVAAKSSGSYQIATLAKDEALKKGFDDALMLDINNNVSECTACNIFWKKGNVIYTPLTHSILDGITRKIVIKLLRQHNIVCKISDYKIDHLFEADEIFLTGTASEIINVSMIGKRKFEDKTFTQFLMNKFEEIKIGDEFELD